jgi:hypothetical protein
MRLTHGLTGWLMICGAVPASSQVFYGVSGGFGLAGPRSDNPGFLAQASLGHRDAHGQGWRVDAFAAGPFEGGRRETVWTGAATCAYGHTCSNFATITTPVSVGVAGLALNDLIPLHASSNGTSIYAIVAGEVDRLLEGQGAPQNILFGASPGVGIALAPEGRQRTFVEARLHGIANAGGLPDWTFLISVGPVWSAGKL